MPARTMSAGRLGFHICDADFAGGFGCRHFFCGQHLSKRKKIFQKCYILLKIKHIKSDAKKYNKKVQTKQRKRGKKMKKKIVSVTLAMMMCLSPVTSVYADREDDLREEQAWTNDQLNSMYSRMDDLYAQKQQLENEINTLDANLVNVMVSIQTLETDIANKQTSIENTQKDLEKAQKAKDKQYEAMKKRIQYLYEKGGNAAWFQMMMNSENLTDLLNNAEYTQKMYEYDRQSLEKYANTITQVQQLGEKYQQEKADMESMKQEQEAEQANLQTAIDSKRASSADCDNEIAYAQQMANEYASLIQEQQAEIEQIVAEKEAAEEAARAETERIAAEQAEAEAAEAEQEEADDVQYDEDGNIINNNEENNAENADDNNDEDNAETAGTAESENTDTSSDYEYDEYGNVIDNNTSADSNSSSDTSTNTSTGSGSGSSVVDYATQFVGNPYVWGGTSLTNGADCSGFVQSVYSNFGVSLPRTSYEQQNAGREVSYSDAQPGDLICYGGHVAIYMGNGKIVHASNSRDGIKVSDNAAYRTILSVRRLV